MGKPDTLAYGVCGYKETFAAMLNKTNQMLFNVQFANRPAVEFLNVLARIKDDDRPKSLIYCDPPYLGTEDNYSHSFAEADSLDLFNCLDETGCKYAMSEFDHPFIMQQAKERGLNVVTIGERQNLKNRRTEILVMNYNQVPTLF